VGVDATGAHGGYGAGKRGDRGQRFAESGGRAISGFAFDVEAEPLIQVLLGLFAG